MFDLVIKNGNVILEHEVVRTDVAILDGKIAEIGTDLNGEEVIDATGLIVSPGMIDAHVHITEPGGGYRDNWEGYVTGTSAAAKGGVTSFMEMPLNQVPATVDHSSFQTKLTAGQGKLKTDVYSYGGLVPTNLDGGIQALDIDGVIAYKAFTATAGDRTIPGDFENVDDYSLYEGMRQIAETGKILTVHAENAAITDKLGELAKASGETSLKAYVHSRPVLTEVEAIRRVLYFAKETGCRVHIAHVSSEEGVQEVIDARNQGVDVTCETCTHYLYFHEDELDAIGPSVKCSPPIRDEQTREALWKLVKSGAISFITSDHSPCDPALKDTANAFEAWGGISGIQSNISVLFDEGVLKRDLPLTTFAHIIATNVADRFDIPEKGRLAPGYDADVVLIDPDASFTLTKEALEYRHPLTPYLGRTFKSQVARTILRGETIYDRDTGVSESFNGRFVNAPFMKEGFHDTKTNIHS